nr:MAG TPA: hypothetical protein [Caudoviricetes sp.]
MAYRQWERVSGVSLFSSFLRRILKSGRKVYESSISSSI